MKLFNSSLPIKLLAIALVVTMSACASKKSSKDDPNATDETNKSESVMTQGSEDGDINTVSNSSSKSLNAMTEVELAQLLNQKELFFAYDSFSIDSKSEKIAFAHGKFLAKTPAARVRLEGHTDERGTREYNLALGERRAKSVQQVLLSAGAKSNQIEVITYGEERPKAAGATENAYSQNRRVDIEYTVGRP